MFLKRVIEEPVGRSTAWREAGDSDLGTGWGLSKVGEVTKQASPEARTQSQRPEGEPLPYRL